MALYAEHNITYAESVVHFSQSDRAGKPHSWPRPVCYCTDCPRRNRLCQRGLYFNARSAEHNAGVVWRGRYSGCGQSLHRSAPPRGARREHDFQNHSCEPNIGVQGQIVFVAMRDIAAGEELTHDWATTDDEDYRMECRCGAATCRKIVTGKDWQKPELQEKY